MKQLTCGSLFAGIGGFDLGFERAGIKTIWQVEIDEYCRRVLAKHFPDAKRYADIRECGGCGQFRKDTPNRLTAVDIIAGGFPCQDVSQAQTTNERGIDGERSGLWKEMLRIVCEVRPRYVAVENVSALLNGGIGVVLGDLAKIEYDAEWESLPAAAFGAPHIRERVFLLAYATGKRFVPCDDEGDERQSSVPEGDDRGTSERSQDWKLASMVPGIRSGADADWWRAQSRMVRSVDGIPDWMDRIHALGNAVVPQITEWIGRRIVEAESGVSA